MDAEGFWGKRVEDEGLKAVQAFLFHWWVVGPFLREGENVCKWQYWSTVGMG